MRLYLVSLLLAGATIPVAAQQSVYRISVSGTIDGGMAPYVARALRQAEVGGASAVILDINTPGGRIDAAEAIVDAIRATRVPVYAWVNPRAYSAGALISIATDGIYMHSGAVLGAATPVDGQGAKLPEKYVSAMRGEFRALAQANGLDPAIAEAMVDDSRGVPGLLPAGQLLTLSTDEAIRVAFARGKVDSQKDLLTAIGLPDASVVTVGVNWAESLVQFFTNPLVAPLLLSLGLLGLVFEIKAGAFGLGGVLSLLSLGLFFGAHYLVGLAGLEEVILLLAGLVSIAIEVFLLPGFGVAGILGMVLLGAAIVMAMLGPSPSWSDVAQSLAVLGATLVLTLAVVITWFRHLPNSTRFRGLLLKEGLHSGEGYVSAVARNDLVGKDAVALTDLRPSGTVSIDGERIDVVTEGDYVRAGTVVRIVRAEGHRHVVRANT
ncbi:MAG: NfeD family protein [Gemmatimonadota bacterium]